MTISSTFVDTSVFYVTHIYKTGVLT